MRTDAKGYFLKEYGSWSVLIVSFITGLCVSREWTWKAIPLFFALGTLINSKQGYSNWLRRKGGNQALFIFLGHIVAAAVVLFALFRSDIPRLLPLLVFPAAYLLMNRLAGEHFVLTELLGFSLISLAAVLAKFLVTGGIDVRLFIAVALYFGAGVFKVKVLLKKNIGDRIYSALYILFSAYAYHEFHVPLIILLPLIDNLAVAIRPYKVKLRMTGWIEVAKSLLFLALMVLFY